MNNVNADTLTALFVIICVGILTLVVGTSFAYYCNSKEKSKAKPLDTSKTEEKEEETVEQEEEEKPKEEKPKYDFIYKVSDYGVTIGILKITENPIKHRIEKERTEVDKRKILDMIRLLKHANTVKAEYLKVWGSI